MQEKTGGGGVSNQDVGVVLSLLQIKAFFLIHGTKIDCLAKFSKSWLAGLVRDAVFMTRRTLGK